MKQGITTITISKFFNPPLGNRKIYTLRNNTGVLPATCYYHRHLCHTEVVFLQKSFYLKRFINVYIAIGGGLLLWAAWPVSSLTFLIFVAWVPLLWLESKIESRKKFLVLPISPCLSGMYPPPGGYGMHHHREQLAHFWPTVY